VSRVSGTTTACGLTIDGFVPSTLRIAALVIVSALSIAKSAYHEIIARKLKLGLTYYPDSVNALLPTQPPASLPNPKVTEAGAPLEIAQLRVKQRRFFLRRPALRLGRMSVA
jgi:hypothetical protein